MSISLASIGAALSVGQAIASDVVPLFTFAAQVMENIEATSTASGENKKTSVLNIVGLVAANAGKDFSLIATDLSKFIDTTKTLYNEAVSAVSAVTTIVSAANQAASQAPAPAPQPAAE